MVQKALHFLVMFDIAGCALAATTATGENAPKNYRLPCLSLPSSLSVFPPLAVSPLLSASLRSNFNLLSRLTCRQMPLSLFFLVVHCGSLQFSALMTSVSKLSLPPRPECSNHLTLWIRTIYDSINNNKCWTIRLWGQTQAALWGCIHDHGGLS